MSKFHDLLHLRFRQKDTPQNKMSLLVERSQKGDLSSFSGVFRVSKLSVAEEAQLLEILQAHTTTEPSSLQEDLAELSLLTSEVKAITNQAVILHGERIKKAQTLLKKYQDGAFTAWLFATYGNRQTPYNFLQYYEFYRQVPSELHQKIDTMPRQAIYTLASRQGDLEKKVALISTYQGETKGELLSKIRQEFPLDLTDKRHPNFASLAIHLLKKARENLQHTLCVPSEKEKTTLEHLSLQIESLIEKL